MTHHQPLKEKKKITDQRLNVKMNLIWNTNHGSSNLLSDMFDCQRPQNNSSLWSHNKTASSDNPAVFRRSCWSLDCVWEAPYDSYSFLKAPDCAKRTFGLHAVSYQRLHSGGSKKYSGRRNNWHFHPLSVGACATVHRQEEQQLSATEASCLVYRQLWSVQMWWAGT